MGCQNGISLRIRNLNEKNFSVVVVINCVAETTDLFGNEMVLWRMEVKDGANG